MFSLPAHVFIKNLLEAVQKSVCPKHFLQRLHRSGMKIFWSKYMRLRYENPRFKLMPSLIQVFHLSFPCSSAQWIFIVGKWKGFKQERSGVAEQTPSLVAESLSTCAAGQLKPLSQPCTHPTSPGLLLPIHLWRAGNRKELLIHGHYTCNNSIFVLLLTNISIPRAAHLPLMLISLPMLPALEWTFRGFPLAGVSHQRGCFRGAHCKYYPRLFLCCSEW